MSVLKRNIISLFVFVFSAIGMYANMAAPWINGTGNTDAYISRDIDILKEYLKVTLLDFDRAEFDVQYVIKVNNHMLQVPFIFDTSISFNKFGRGNDDHMDFRVLLDSREIEISEVVSMYNDSISERWMREFRNNFDGNLKDLYSFKYFELDLDEGEHIIQVKYIANAGIDLRGELREYYFVYNLKPARYWKSFGGLDLTIDAFAIKGETSVDIGNDDIVDGIYNRYFNELPQDEFIITCVPHVSPTVKWFMKYGMDIVFILTFCLVILHFIIMYRYRKRNFRIWISPVVICGVLLLPLIFCVFVVFTPYFIDDIIGEHASRRHGYMFLWFVLYPVFLIVYMIPVLILDYVFRKKFSER